MKSYVYVSENKREIVHRLQARDLAHAALKLEALHGVTNPGSQLMSHADFKDELNASLEPMGLAPWQKALNRKTNNLW